MRIAVLTQCFSRKMGYAENMLPKYLARQGVDVHVITTDLPPYFEMHAFADTYSSFNAPIDLTPGAVEHIDGYTLHVLAHQRVLGYPRMIGLRDKLTVLRPDVVQCMEPVGWIPLDAAVCRFLGYKLFTEAHTHTSVFPLAQRKRHWLSPARLSCGIRRGVPGRLTSVLSTLCYAISPDCADVAVRFSGVQKSKVVLCPLGVDTELFRPIQTPEDRQTRQEVRSALGFTVTQVVCVYSGRLSPDKNPLLLAKAVSALADKGLPYGGLFIGAGAQAAAVKACTGCIVHAFVPVGELAPYYWAADIGVWPAQESLSMLDAAACGLPLVVNDTISATERIRDNALTYRLNDLSDLIRALAALQDADTRARLGAVGATRMASHYSWEAVARRRLGDYDACLNGATSRRSLSRSKDVSGNVSA